MLPSKALASREDSAQSNRVVAGDVYQRVWPQDRSAHGVKARPCDIVKVGSV